MFSDEIRAKRVQHRRQLTHWRRRLDEIFVRITGKHKHLWRAVDHEGEVGAENSHRPFRRRERAMLRFRRMKTLQKFASVHGSVHKPFEPERHLVSREIYKQRRSAALADWRAAMG